jgi:transposase
VSLPGWLAPASDAVVEERQGSMIWSGGMSLWPREDRGIPAETERVARAAFPNATFCMRVRDVLGPLFTDEAFAGLFSGRGRPAESPGTLAVVSVLQFVEGLTDAQAADAVRGRVDWKYLLGLELTDQGFDSSVLSEFRSRLVESGSAEVLLFESVLDRLKAANLLAPGGRARTDSTHVLGAIRSLERLELVGETLRAALEAIAAAAPDWLRAFAPSDWFTHYGPRVDAYRLPKAESERLELALRIGADGVKVLERVWRDDAPVFVKVLPAVESLRAIWVQQYYRDPAGLRWRTREVHGRPPGATAITSPYDLDARYSVKRGAGWNGYKVQICETCDDDLPHLITYVDTVPATEADIDTTPRVHESLARRALAPAEHLADSAYVTADAVLDARDRHGIELIGPIGHGNQWQSKNPDAFDTDAFAVDWDTLTAVCPQGRRNTWSGTGTDRHGKPRVMFTFSMTDCTPCPVRSRCTRAKTAARTVTLRPREQHELLRGLRAEQQTERWRKRYAARSGIEGTISQAVRAFDLRRCRYKGLAKTRVQNILIATAVNLTRLDAWFAGKPLGRTRVSHLAALATA